MTTNLFVIANVKQLRTDGSFRILLSFFRTSWSVGVLNSAIFNSFHNRVEFGTILEGLPNFFFGGGGFEAPPPVLHCLVTLIWNRGRGKTDSKFPEDGSFMCGSWQVQTKWGDFHLATLDTFSKYSLFSAQTARLRTSWRYNWLSLIHCSLVTRCDEEGTNGGRADIIRWARFCSGLNTDTPAVTKQTTRKMLVLCSVFTFPVKQQAIICKHYWQLLNNAVSESTCIQRSPICKMNYLLADSHDLLIYPFGKRNMYMKTRMGCWWNDTDRLNWITFKDAVRTAQ